MTRRCSPRDNSDNLSRVLTEKLFLEQFNLSWPPLNPGEEKSLGFLLCMVYVDLV
ncbi:MAG TPA: hypothetical protein IGR64_17895 [Leptolyngbyaceae cyanobacterium M65_K2018_010]|nr:hypothetical protein [Leptolyngbyaceae cyanobacterium M65_K2018_010]